jgi:hypothetical protein
MTVPGFEQREFRDIEAFDANTAVVLAIAEPGQIIKNNRWRKELENGVY